MNYRKKALEQKGEQCQNCGDGTDLEVHHRDKNRCNNDIENLVVLCRECHHTVHHGWPEPGSFLRTLKIDTGVQLPSPVYREAVAQSEQEGVSPGEVVRDWMQKAEQYDHVGEAMRGEVRE